MCSVVRYVLHCSIHKMVCLARFDRQNQNWVALDTKRPRTEKRKFFSITTDTAHFFLQKIFNRNLGLSVERSLNNYLSHRKKSSEILINFRSSHFSFTPILGELFNGSLTTPLPSKFPKLKYLPFLCQSQALD